MGFADDVIRQFYPTRGAAGCRPLLPAMSKEQIRSRARRMGVAGPAAPGGWTAEEDAVVIAACESGAWRDAVPMLPGRSEGAVRQRSIKLQCGNRRGGGLPFQPFADAHRAWQSVDRTIPAANDGPLLWRVA